MVWIIFSTSKGDDANKPEDQFEPASTRTLILLLMNIEVQRWSKPTAPDAQELKARLSKEGYSVFQWSDAPGTKYGPHAHAEDQSHWILAGELELRVGYETYVLRAGDRDFLPANTLHSAFVPGNQPVIYLIGAKH